MAVTKTKPSLRRNQWLRKVLRFPQAKGKTVESIEFSTELGYHAISVNFPDKTSINFEIEARFLVEADYSNWKAGQSADYSPLHPVQNLEFRDTL